VRFGTLDERHLRRMSFDSEVSRAEVADLRGLTWDCCTDE
jgi:hypothetical protein